MSDPYASKPVTADYVLREGDTGPALVATLLDLDGSTVDLSDASEVRLYVRPQGSDELVINTTVTIDSAVDGEVSHEFSDGLSTTTTGMHELYFRVQFSSGAIESYPRAETAYLWVPEHFDDLDPADLDPADAEVGVLTADTVRTNSLSGRDGTVDLLSSVEAGGNDITNVGSATIANQLGIPVYSDDANAPTETHYFNDVDGVLKYKDAAGTVHAGGVENPMTETLDADGNDVTNVGALESDSVSTDKATIGDGIYTQEVGETVQDAINRLSSGDVLYLLPGTYDENVTVSTADVTIIGTGRGTLIDGGTGDAIGLEASGITLSQLAVKTTAGGGNTARGIRAFDADNPDELDLNHIWVEGSDADGIRLGTTDSRIVSVYCDSANIDGADVVLDGNSSSSVADDIIGTVSDSGTGNSIGETA